jgi:hypothetical protein
MAADHAGGSGRQGGERREASGQAGAEEPRSPHPHALLLLVIVYTEPLSGSVGLQKQPNVRIAFSGWIGLMSAINELRAGGSAAATDSLGQ